MLLRGLVLIMCWGGLCVPMARAQEPVPQEPTSQGPALQEPAPQELPVQGSTGQEALVAEELGFKPLSQREKQEISLNRRLQECPADDSFCQNQVQFLLDLLRSGITLDETMTIRYYEVWPEDGMGPPILLEDNESVVVRVHDNGDIELNALQQTPPSQTSRSRSSPVDDFLIEIFPAQSEESLQKQLRIGVPEAVVGFVISPYVRHKMGHFIQHFLYYRQSDRHIADTQKQLLTVQREKDALLRKKAQSPNMSPTELNDLSKRVEQLEDKKRGIERTLQIKSRERNRMHQKKKTLRPGSVLKIRSRMGRYMYRIMKLSSYLSIPLVAAEVGTRLYVWHIIERDPGPVPFFHAGNQARKKAWGHFLKNYWHKKEKKLTTNTLKP